MSLSADESVNSVVREGTRAIIADTRKHRIQTLKQGEQIKLLQRKGKREIGKQAKEQQPPAAALTQGEKAKMMMRKFLKRNPQKSRSRTEPTEVGQQG